MDPIVYAGVELATQCIGIGIDAIRLGYTRVLVDNNIVVEIIERKNRNAPHTASYFVDAELEFARAVRTYGYGEIGQLVDVLRELRANRAAIRDNSRIVRRLRYARTQTIIQSLADDDDDDDESW